MSAYTHIRTEYEEIQSISPYSTRMREKYRPEKNPEFGHFSRSYSAAL